jgi:hypothetical protein
MKSFAEFREASTVAEKPVYIRREGEQTYDLASDVFTPGIGIKESKEEFLVRLKELRNAGLPANWKGIRSK